MKHRREYLPLSMRECDNLYYLGRTFAGLNWLIQGLAEPERSLRLSAGFLSIIMITLCQKETDRGASGVSTVLLLMGVSCITVVFGFPLWLLLILLGELLLMLISVPLLRLIESYWQKRFCLIRYDVVFLGRPFALAIGGVWMLWYVFALAAIFGSVPTAAVCYAIPAALILSIALCFGFRSAAFPKVQPVVIVRNWLTGREAEYDLSHAAQFRGLSRKQRRRIAELVVRRK